MRRALIFLVVISFSFFSCEEDDPKDRDSETPDKVSESENPEEEQEEGEKQVTVITPLMNEGLRQSSPGILRFAEGAIETESLSKGKILVAGPSKNAPNGYLRKIVSVKSGSGEIVIQTEAATLLEAVDSGQVKFSKTFSPSDTVGNKRLEPFEINVDESFFGEAVNVSGTLRLSPTLDGDISIIKAQSGPRYALLHLELDIVGSLSLDFASSYAQSISLEKDILEVPLTPIKVLIGGIPVVIRPSITISVGLEGEASAGVRASYTREVHTGLILSHSLAQGWVQNTRHETTEDYSPPAIEAEGRLRAYVETSLGLALYDDDFIEAGLATQLYGEMLGQADQGAINLDWTLSAGITGNAFFTAKVFGETIADAQYDGLFGVNKEIAAGTIFLWDFRITSPLYDSEVSNPVLFTWDKYEDGGGETYGYNIRVLGNDGIGGKIDHSEFIPPGITSRSIDFDIGNAQCTGVIEARNGQGEVVAKGSPMKFSIK